MMKNAAHPQVPQSVQRETAGRGEEITPSETHLNSNTATLLCNLWFMNHLQEG